MMEDRMAIFHEKPWTAARKVTIALFSNENTHSSTTRRIYEKWKARAAAKKKQFLKQRVAY